LSNGAGFFKLCKVILVGISRLGNVKVEHVSLVDMILEIVLWNEEKKSSALFMSPLHDSANIHDSDIQ
jgi:hypothetical protein